MSHFAMQRPVFSSGHSVVALNKVYIRCLTAKVREYRRSKTNVFGRHPYMGLDIWGLAKREFCGVYQRLAGSYIVNSLVRIGRDDGLYEMRGLQHARSARDEKYDDA
jgi:hypothetical protein